ncbi:hypothetical protein [Dictyobacter formicarum]|uniref:Uncharacterized protein n=1 Tax=Dictyobacter formicarum TaxID=2778368 RepID=A0ABQ3VNR9_9CHLR|nr:hypothetical protein [Dictyobacter formicarum]GHO87890.1 hypothetical protein KSZ_58960 [Dictyobacter formicarum]
MFGEPIVECVYGWGQILQLYPDHVDIQGTSYSLHDLINFKPVYRRIMGVPSMRLELQFISGIVVIRGIADISLALKVIAYLHTWSGVHLRYSVEEVHVTPELPARATAVARTPQPLVLSEGEQERFWEYDAHDQPTVAAGPFDAVVDGEAETIASSGMTSPMVPLTLDAVTSWPWTDERHREHLQRRQRLQREREVRFYGFDVEALAKSLQTEPLPQIAVPAVLLDGECAHYCTEARLCDDPPGDGKRARAKVKDQGRLILTNLRLIYLGQQRHITLGYEHMLQYSHVPGAVMVSTTYWRRQQFFVMRRPLECAMYLEHIWRHFQDKILPAASQYLLPASTQSLRAQQALRKRETVQLPVLPVCSECGRLEC